MQKLKSSITNMVLVLVGVAVIMGAILAYVNQLTTPAIKAINEKNTQDAIAAVLPGVKSDKIEDEETTLNIGGKDYAFVLHKAMAGGECVGTAVESTSGGFGGDLKIMVGFDKEGKILGYSLLAHAETPGLGAKADTWFQEGQKGNIIGKNPSSPLTVSKDGGDVDAITASTITSRAFLLAVNNAYQAACGKSEADGQTAATAQK
ncbi:MAG: RnfABCDGE type electron transport complex subunit G [Bacteroidaceae bacterium]|nr:RnfABCDGE type electron transport complex subunit G [Bacteroidaceae bacterium]